MIAIVIHGGAGKIASEDRAPYLAGLLRARDAGYQVLADGGTAIAAILAAVTTMEDDLAAFNAGTGGSPNRDGVVECDAAIMSADGTSGAVAAVTRAKNPILLADKVRVASPHALIVGPGADALVEDPIDNAELLTPRTLRALERWREADHLGPKGSATVGAVALDDQGMLAAATSTGGMLGKWPGRVGDAPLIGAGTYAARHVGVSCTGDGEAFIRAVTAKGLADRLQTGVELEAAVRLALDEVAAQNANGGLIVLTADGRIASGFNARDMAYAWRTAAGADACVSAEPCVRSFG
ncbi:MAG: isoaspartyl peptidase/L-asparaginase [Trueperaceae bacterium]|jgi:beta-aspartyl-peptidase (threonine type)|nr:isoaspartyl peptidase/L-asparaginase [Trueperaceae bacterium]